MMTALVVSVPAQDLSGKRPNIIVILTDDQGYGDIAANGNPILKTPNLDRLHDEGVRFSDFHVSPTCSPTRSALMSGRHEFKNGVTHTILERERMSLRTVTIAQVLKSAGYTTGIFGKWHLGDEDAYQPDQRGFNEVFIHGAGGIGQTYPGSCGDAPGNKYFDPVIKHNGKFEKTTGFCTDVFTSQALQWIESVKGNQPFFCYIPFNAPHGPLFCPPGAAIPYQEKVTPNEATFFGMIANIDDNVGRLLAKLQEWRIDQDTLVVFMNDNGGTVGCQVFNAGMRGEKCSAWEGGTRASSFWRWPGTLKPDNVDKLTGHVDVFPTLAELAGAKLEDNVKAQVEGRSLIPLLKNPQSEWADRYFVTHVGRWESNGTKPLKFGNAGGQCSIRNSRYSLVHGHKDWQLFDLKQDPGQEQDIAAQHLDIVNEFSGAYDQWWQEVLPHLENEEAHKTAPKVNPFREQFQKQFGTIPETKTQSNSTKSVKATTAKPPPETVSAPARARASQIFVAPSGNDKNPGTLEKPLATLQRAQQVARERSVRDALTISIRAGTYYLPETLVFTSADSGTKTAPVVYQAYQHERPVISGGIRLMDLKWESYKDGIMRAKVPAGFTTDQLFVNGDLQPLARYPNIDPAARVFHGTAADAFSPKRAAFWKDPDGGFIHALHSAEWGGMHYVITGKGPDNKVTYDGGWQNNRPMGMHEQHRFVENIFEELDAPGEWFLDSKNNLLNFYPPTGTDLTSATIEAVRLKHLVELRGTEQAPVRFVNFKGLTFRHAARTFMDTKELLLRTDWAIYRGGALFLNGTEDCAIEDCVIDQVGGNAVFVNNYNRRVMLRGCHIARAGGSGVAFLGDPGACRNPATWNKGNELANIDRTPGPRTNNYPADCLVDDCLIHDIGQIEKQTAGVTVDIAQGITVRHCSIFDTPRSGINIGDGCWGGHLIEFCDVFDTVKETGDHGSFNSWGRDRFWGLRGLNLNDDAEWDANKSIVTLDAVKTTTICNSRWRCDHGWDVDLDDGSSNYHIYNNLFLHGGLKNREGFFRLVENNIMVNNGFHPHVWYRHSEDIVRRNIMGTDHYLPAGGMPSTPWGKEMDFNLVHREGLIDPQPAKALADQSQRDEHSIVADAMFVDLARGDFRVKDGSPALKLGFVNFPMDQFGVQKPELKAIARTPEIPSWK